MKPYRYFAPTEICFGAGNFNLLPEMQNRYGAKPLVITGKSFARNSGLLGRLLTLLPYAVIFEGVEENPADTTCDKAAALCRDNNCDSIVAIGGGSPLDAAKAVAMLATNEGRCSDYYGFEKYVNTALPIIAIPTTSGTGSECTQYAIITDEKQHAKFNISGRDLFPRVSILDPELTYTMPRNITLATGLDALSQGMESYVSNSSTPPGDVLSLEVCRLISKWLPVVLEEPGNQEGRAAMQHAAMMSGYAIAQSGTTIVHAAGYALTTRFGVAHGIANAILLPAVFEFNSKIAPEKTAVLAECIGNANRTNPNIREVLNEFYTKINFDSAGKNYGIDLETLRLDAKALADAPARLKNQMGNPDAEDIFGFYEAAYNGIAN